MAHVIPQSIDHQIADIAHISARNSVTERLQADAWRFKKVAKYISYHLRRILIKYFEKPKHRSKVEEIFLAKSKGMLAEKVAHTESLAIPNILADKVAMLLETLKKYIAIEIENVKQKIATILKEATQIPAAAFPSKSKTGGLRNPRIKR